MPLRGSSLIVDLEETIRLLAPRVLRDAAARLRGPNLAEEVSQESLAALVRRCRNGGPPDSTEAFVFAIAITPAPASASPAVTAAVTGPQLSERTRLVLDRLQVALKKKLPADKDATGASRRSAQAQNLPASSLVQ